ncbi:MAG: hypothetical protein KA419_14845 [Acidobacteria bacterium]|nr:hypothetical protein [Acidobacteriota bacterium]
MARLTDPTGRLDAEGAETLRRMTERRKAVGAGLPGPYGPLLHQPHLAERVDDLGFYLRYASRLPRDLYEFVVLCFARRHRVPYVWATHAGPAAAAGLGPDVLDALRRDDPLRVPEPYRTAAAVAEAAMAYRSLAPDLQAEALERFGAAALVEIVTLCGFYAIMGMVGQAFELPLPPGTDAPFAPE